MRAMKAKAITSLIITSCCVSVASTTTAEPIADSFIPPVYPVDQSRQNANGYYVASGYFDIYNEKYHLGEDWNINTGGSSDLGEPVYAIANGRVVWSRDVETIDSWGKIVILRHTLADGSQVDSLYAHLDEIMVDTLSSGEIVSRGQQIGTIGDANGYYQDAAHLHLELRTGLTLPSLGGIPGNPYIESADDPKAANYLDPSKFQPFAKSPSAHKAQQDMIAVSKTDSRYAGIKAGNYVVNRDWAADYELQMMAFYFRQTDNAAYFAHATKKSDPSHRYVAVWDLDLNRWSEWTPFVD